MRGLKLILITGLDTRVEEEDLYKGLEFVNIHYLKILRNLLNISYGIACICVKNYITTFNLTCILNQLYTFNCNIRIYILSNDETTIKANNIVLVKISKEVKARELFHFYSSFGKIISSEVFENFSEFNIGLFIFKNEDNAKYALKQTDNLLWKGFNNQTFPLFLNKFRTPITNTVYFKIKLNFQCSKEKCIKEIYKKFTCFGEISRVLVNNYAIIEKNHNLFDVFLTFKHHLSLVKFQERFCLLKLNDYSFRKMLKIVKDYSQNFFPQNVLYSFLIYLIQTENKLNLLLSDRSLLIQKIEKFKKNYSLTIDNQNKFIKYFILKKQRINSLLVKPNDNLTEIKRNKKRSDGKMYNQEIYKNFFNLKAISKNLCSETLVTNESSSIKTHFFKIKPLLYMCIFIILSYIGFRI